MSTLHIVNRSPYGSRALKRCLTLCSPGDCILLIEDGVYAASVPSQDEPATFSDTQSEVRWYALDSDLAARGVVQRHNRIEKLNYNGFVELVCRCSNSVNWS